MDEKDLAFSVMSTEAGGHVAAEDLSRGTADQLYLVARLGLVRLVTMDRRPPLVLDDPFVTFDPDRAEVAISVLREAAAEQGVQVLFLTWSDRFDAHADDVIELPAPLSPVMAPTTTPDPTPPSAPDRGPDEASLWERLVDEDTGARD